MFLVTHSRGFAINLPATRYTKQASFIFGLQDNSRGVVIAGAITSIDGSDDIAFAWVSGHRKPVWWRGTSLRAKLS
jgi:hypothetical protein